jgi:predicted regulator of Ras-like GTPase activity (Roadblock/LC7/MglB family)
VAIPHDLTPRDVPDLLRELSPDVRAAVLLDAAGGLVAAGEEEPDHADELAGLVRELIDAADSSGGSPPEQIEVQVAGGSVYVSRDPHHVLAAVTRRAALASLMLYDQRALLAALEAQE